jgi:hypothetical protein
MLINLFRCLALALPCIQPRGAHTYCTCNIHATHNMHRPAGGDTVQGRLLIDVRKRWLSNLSKSSFKEVFKKLKD